ncbi:MAG: PKD domain-containing protein [Methanobacteriota archaeon]|nr:MAG: PKD domain-containing protein [Euryarchaeota archaeon]
MDLFPDWARSNYAKCATVFLGFVLLASGFAMVGQKGDVTNSLDNPVPNAASYYAIPSEDPDDGKFLGLFGINMSTISGLETIIYIGVPANQTSFEVGIFDADLSANWDYISTPGVANFSIYKDPLKNGDVSKFLDSWTSNDGINDAYINRSYLTDSDARAPSGNFFYRLEVKWESGPYIVSANLFKVRSTGQLSLAKNQEFGFVGAPQNINVDPCVGQPGNSYNGAWDFYFYVPKERTVVKFRDGDADRYQDNDDFNTPNVDPDGGGPAGPEGARNGAPEDTGPDNPYGTCAIIEPSVYYFVRDPAGNEYNNSDPSGDTEWENFVIEYNGTNADHNTTHMLPAGLWQLSIRALDAHNGDYYNTSFEIFTTTDPPLPVNPPPDVVADTTKVVQPDVTVAYPHTITNKGLADNFDLTAVSSNGWVTRIYDDLDADGQVDPGEPIISETGQMGPNQAKYIVVELDVPIGTEGKSDKMTVTASSQNEWAVQGSAIDTTIVVKNEMPVAKAGGPYSARENEPIKFNGSGSVDPEGDPLEFRWDFESDGIWDTSWSSDPTATKVWGDDYSGRATLEVRDPGGQSSTDTAYWVVYNALPSASITLPSPLDEGKADVFGIVVTDPGSDDMEIIWDWADGTADTWTIYNNGVSPDPSPSPDINPVVIHLNTTHEWGDNGDYLIALGLKDDDGGVMNYLVTIVVNNLVPVEVSFSSPSSTDEGVAINAKSTVSDPGSDVLTFKWDWGDGLTDTEVFYNDGVGPDPPKSPHGTYPFTATSVMTHIYGDDGTFSLVLTVTDDDGDSLVISTDIAVSNLPPRVTRADFPSTSDEGEEVKFSIDVTDPGSDDIILEFDWGDGTTETVVFYNDGVGPDPDPSPLGTYPFSISADVPHTYGDDGKFTVTVTVSDDDAGSVTTTRDIVVNNVNPTIDPNSVEAKAIVDLTLRVAGEKWHDVSLDIVRGGVAVQLLYIVREPGSPDEQSKTAPDVTVNLFEDIPLIVHYTPLDDPINGQLWGSTPVWVIVGFEDGSEAWLNHTFNVRHPNTWTWEIRDISSFFIGQDITFSAAASDPGSDDLTFKWDWGDGTTSTSIYYNDGVGPDPYPSPDVNPITVTDTQTHSFPLPRVYTITITVTDDDGGSDSLSFTLKL